MHELGITRNIVAIILEEANGKKVKRVTLEIGKLSAIIPDSIHFCFDICCKETLLEGAVLEIIEIQGIGKCLKCKTENKLSQPYGKCNHCGSFELEIIQGQELKIKEMEL
ncbi:MAG: hydrogenase maturation nickel metallochaperone HypA [Candidatus Atelocyanobacterium thalassa]|uniref:Hydrogenase maturation factor HypA n=1 Tax=Candidatus Atelocyanobacterium thalassa isolate SIO64986 TaxID=1527444 RepID=A0A086CFR0_9CHRO|nr:MAG: hydrogenase nickel insertion protein HypA [Candidatus Atelocyanobacterium thalassa isolate SIO64986]